MRPLLPYLLFVLMLSGCLPGGPAPASISTPTATPVPEPVTITWSFWGDPWEVAINEQVVRVFEADHPHIKVETVHRPWSEYFTELRPQLESDAPDPDVLFWAEVANDVPKGFFLDLSPFMEADNYRLDDFFPGLLQHFRVGGGIYGLPRDSDTKVIFYNKRLFNQANQPYPKENWTWDDLRTTAQKIKEANVAEYSFAYEANDWWLIWMWQNGVEVFDDKISPTETDLDDPAAAEAVQFLADLTNVDQVTPPYEQLNSSAIAKLFSEGEVAMVFGNHALIPAFAQIDDFEWEIVGLPHQERRANLAAGAGYVISADTPHPEEAWTFLKFLSSPKGQAIFTEAGVAVPARRSVAQSDIFMNQQPPHEAEVFLDETELGEPNFAFPGADKFMTLMNQALVPVWRGEQDAASAIQSILPEVEKILAESQEKL